MLTRWDKFAKAHLDPPPNRVAGRRMIESGEIAGVPDLNGWPWVDVEAWMTRGQRTKTITERALDLLA